MLFMCPHTCNFASGNIAALSADVSAGRSRTGVLRQAGYRDSASRNDSDSYSETYPNLMIYW